MGPETGALRTEDGTIIFSSYQQAERLQEQLRRLFPDARPIGIEEIGVTGRYRTGLEHPQETAIWNISQGASVLGDRSAVDWWTHTETEALARTVADRFQTTPAFDRVGKRAEIPAYLEHAFPGLGRCGMADLALEPVWERVREDGDGLYETTRQVIENVSNGREFEQYFREFCDRNALRWYRETAAELRRRRPDLVAGLPTLTGMPDFLVDRGTTSSMADFTGMEDREWEPRQGFALVEVKYNQSPLSPDQQEMIGRLRDRGIDSYLFRGDGDGLSIELLDG